MMETFYLELSLFDNTLSSYVMTTRNLTGFPHTKPDKSLFPMFNMFFTSIFIQVKVAFMNELQPILTYKTDLKNLINEYQVW